jgi:hypothetical protein
MMAVDEISSVFEKEIKSAFSKVRTKPFEIVTAKLIDADRNDERRLRSVQLDREPKQETRREEIT